MADIFAPRAVLTRHLQQLVEQGILRHVGQAREFGDVLEGRLQAVHLAAYVVFDKYSNVSTQARNQKMTQQYSVIIAIQDARPVRSGHGYGGNNDGEIVSAVMSHVEGLAITDGDTTTTPGYGKRFTLVNADQAFYPPGGWAFYPLSFAIDVINTRTQTP